MKRFIRRLFNRWLHLVARNCPGGNSLRPFLHKLRGVKITGTVWIGDDVYLENDNPENVEMHEGATISMRAIILAHTKGAGKVIIERDAFIGPGAIVCSSTKTLRIGAGAVITAGSVVMSNVPSAAVISPPRAKTVAKATIPFPKAETVDEFVAGLVPFNEKGAAGRRVDKK